MNSAFSYSTPLLRSPSATASADVSSEVRQFFEKYCFGRKLGHSVFHLVCLLFGVGLVWTGQDNLLNACNNFHGLVDCRIQFYFQSGVGAVSGVLLILISCSSFIWIWCCGPQVTFQRMLKTTLTAQLIPLTLLVLFSAQIYTKLAISSIDDLISANLTDSIYRFDYTDPNSTVTVSWNLLQRELNCCGAQTYTDWALPYYAPKKGFIPQSCCLDKKDENCTANITVETDVSIVKNVVFMRGCVQAGLAVFYHKYLWIAFTVLSSVLFVFIFLVGRIEDLISLKLYPSMDFRYPYFLQQPQLHS